MAEDIIGVVEAAGFMLLGDSRTPEWFSQSDVLFVRKNWPELAAASSLNLARPV
jgi:hypothetical protein